MMASVSVSPETVDVSSFLLDAPDLMKELRNQFNALHVKLDAILRRDVAPVGNDVDVAEEKAHREHERPDSVFQWRRGEHKGRSCHLTCAQLAHDGDTSAIDLDMDREAYHFCSGDELPASDHAQPSIESDAASLSDLENPQCSRAKKRVHYSGVTVFAENGSCTPSSQVAKSSMVGAVGSRKPNSLRRTGSSLNMAGKASLRSFQRIRNKRPEDGVGALEGVWLSHAQERTMRNKASKLSPVQDMVSKRAKREYGQPGVIYEMVMGSVIVLNAVYFGVQVELKAAAEQVRWINIVFFGIFVVDVLYRLLYSKKYFFQGVDKWWNAFDIFAVTTMAFELVVSVLQCTPLLRAARVIRFVRFARLVRFAKEDLRELFFLLHIFRSFTMWRFLAWVIFLSCFICYIGAIILTQRANEICEKDDGDSEICARFGSLARSMLSILQATYGGALWGDLYFTLEKVGEFYAICFLCVVAYSKLMFQNLLTGAVLKAVTDCSKLEIDMVVQDALFQNKFEVKQLVHVFGLIDANNSGAVSLDNWMVAFKQQQVAMVMSKFGIHQYDLPQVFALIDGNRQGSLDIFDFVHGVMLLKHDGLLLRLRSWIATLFDEEVGVSSTGSGLRGVVTSRLNSNGELNLPSAQRTSSGPMESLSPMIPSDPPFAMRTSSDCRQHPEEVLAQLRRGCLHTYRQIPKVEQRAMLLEELLGIRKHLLQDEYWKEAWVDFTGKRVPPKQVNLYHLSACFLAPMCAPRGVILKGVKAGNPIVGVPVVQNDPHQSIPSAAGELIEVGDNYITVRVTHGFFKDSSWCDFPVVVDDEACGVPTEVKAPGCISYKELISSEPRSPSWFCSHWWGEHIFDFVSGCEEHARLRGLDEGRASYWVCAYANRQYDLSESITNDPEQSSFRKSMLSSAGTLLHLDSQATPFSRIWCDYELIKTLTDKRKKMDIVTVSLNSDVNVLVDGQLPSESQVGKNQREQHFPITIVALGLVAQLQNGACSVQRDKDVILQSVRKDAIKRKLNPNEAFDTANNILHFRLARAVWPQAIKRGMIDFLDLPRVLAKGGDDVLEMSFADLTELRDEDLKNLADALASALTTIHLSFEGCHSIGDSGVAALSKGIPPSVKSLWLDFVGCHNITDEGIECLARSTPDSLKELRLDLAMCTSLSLGCVEALSKHLPKNISMLGIDLTGTKVDRIFTARSELVAETRKRSRSVQGKLLRLPAAVGAAADYQKSRADRLAASVARNTYLPRSRGQTF